MKSGKKYWADGSGWNGRLSRYCVVGESGEPRITEIYQNKTNNEMEYEGVLSAMVLCEEGSTIYTDSRLVVGQVCDSWKINEPHLYKLAQMAKELAELKKVKLVWIPRAENKAGHILEENGHGQK